MLRLFIVFLLIINALMLYKLFWTQSGVFHLTEIKSAYEEIDKQNQELIQENKQLSQTIRALRKNEKYLKEAIRKEMRYVQDNEVIYFFPEDQKP